MPFDPLHVHHVMNAHTYTDLKQNATGKLAPPSPASGKIAYCIWMDVMVLESRTASSCRVHLVLRSWKKQNPETRAVPGWERAETWETMDSFGDHPAPPSILWLLGEPYLFPSFSDSDAHILPKPVPHQSYLITRLSRCRHFTDTLVAS